MFLLSYSFSFLLPPLARWSPRYYATPNGCWSRASFHWCPGCTFINAAVYAYLAAVLLLHRCILSLLSPTPVPSVSPPRSTVSSSKPSLSPCPPDACFPLRPHLPPWRRHHHVLPLAHHTLVPHRRLLIFASDIASSSFSSSPPPPPPPYPCCHGGCGGAGPHVPKHGDPIFRTEMGRGGAKDFGDDDRHGSVSFSSSIPFVKNEGKKRRKRALRLF